MEKEKKKIVVTAGTFDLLHPGHYETLKFAKSLGDELIVIIARDETVKKIKGRKPVIPEEQRRRMVEALKPVDKAILGSLKDKLEPILKIKPDVIVLGPDQTTFDVEELKNELAKHNIFPEIVKVKEYTKCPFHSSFDIVKEIVRRFGGCKMIYSTLSINTNKRFEIIDITEKINKIIKESNVKNGLLNIFVPHTTAGLLINENEPNLIKDIENMLKELIKDEDYNHDKIDNNARAHLMSCLLKSDLTIPIIDGKILGTWQSILFVECDGPRSREVIVSIRF